MIKCNFVYTIFSTGLNVLKQVGGIVLPDLIKKLKIKSLNSDISDFFIGVVKNTVEYRENNNVSRKDFLQLLIQLKNHGKLDKTILTDDETTDGENSLADGQTESKLHKVRFMIKFIKLI